MFNGDALLCKSEKHFIFNVFKNTAPIFREGSFHYVQFLNSSRYQQIVSKYMESMFSINDSFYQV